MPKYPVFDVSSHKMESSKLDTFNTGKKNVQIKKVYSLHTFLLFPKKIVQQKELTTVGGFLVLGRSMKEKKILILSKIHTKLFSPNWKEYQKSVKL